MDFPPRHTQCYICDSLKFMFNLGIYYQDAAEGRQSRNSFQDFMNHEWLREWVEAKQKLNGPITVQLVNCLTNRKRGIK